MRMKKITDEVFYADQDIVEVSKEDIEFLKKKALQNERKRCRLCTHKDVNDKVHEMIIVHTKDTYVMPHKHLDKSEAFHIIEGEADVVILDDDGTVRKVISMGEYSSGKNFYYRLSEPFYHTLLIKSDIIVFHEATKGPFSKDDTLFAQWSPEEGDISAQRKFIKELEKSIKNH